MKKITETNCDKKEGICEHYIPHYIKREGAINSERDFRKTQQKTPNNIENSLQMIA